MSLRRVAGEAWARRALVGLAIGLTWACGCGSRARLEGTVLEPRPAADVGAFHIARERGKVVVVTFGFTTCPDVCPLTLSRMKAALRSLGDDAARVTMAFVTVDPERDRPDRLEAYVAAFDRRIVPVLAEGRALVAALAAYGATAEKRIPDADRYRNVPGAASRSSYGVDHTAGFFVVDPRGRLRLHVRHDAPAASLASDVRQLLNEPAPRPVRIEAPVAHVTPAGVGAVYLRIVNPADEEDRLVRAESAAAERVEMHESVKDGDIVRMLPHERGFAVPARQTVDLARGGKHLMLLGVRPSDGAKRIPLTLRFERSGALSIDAPLDAGP
jgi:protein SCO1